MLSWHAPKTVDHTLSSFAGRDIFSLFDHCRLYCQEITAADHDVADKYGFEIAGNDSNQGIYGGIKALFEWMPDDYVLFVENDCVLVEDKKSVEQQINAAVQDMEDGAAEVFRLRHRRRPGEDFSTLNKYLRYHAPGNESWLSVDAGLPFTRGLRRLLRPAKAARLQGIAAYAEPAPEKRFPNVFARTANNNLVVSSRHINWTNQAILCRRRWLLEEILPWVAAHPSNRTVNGFPDIEKELNCRWWRQQDFHIGLTPGLFTHQRLDR